MGGLELIFPTTVASRELSGTVSATVIIGPEKASVLHSNPLLAPAHKQGWPVRRNPAAQARHRGASNNEATTVDRD